MAQPPQKQLKKPPFHQCLTEPEFADQGLEWRHNGELGHHIHCNECGKSLKKVKNRRDIRQHCFTLEFRSETGRKDFMARPEGDRRGNHYKHLCVKKQKEREKKRNLRDITQWRNDVWKKDKDSQQSKEKAATAARKLVPHSKTDLELLDRVDVLEHFWENGISLSKLKKKKVFSCTGCSPSSTNICSCGALLLCCQRMYISDTD